MVRHSTDSHRAEPSLVNAANLGMVRPPLVYLSSIALGLVVHYAWPARFVPPSLSTPLGALLTLLAVGLFVAAIRTFRAAGTPVPGNQPTTAIVRRGPYRVSRNPIYLAFSLFQLGLAVWVNSLGLLMTLIPAHLLMALVVIPREERYLEARFPSEYASYTAVLLRRATTRCQGPHPSGSSFGLLPDGLRVLSRDAWAVRG
ncbi:MAG TPA: isoprenylcysteine carboxylmethyltransferase family protein [Gemmatimonadales bacterium]